MIDCKNLIQISKYVRLNVFNRSEGYSGVFS